MKKQRVLPTLIGLLLLAIALPLALSTRAKSATVPQRDRIQRVEVATVRQDAASRTLRFSGALQAATRADLSFSVGGRISSRPVELGESVQMGQIVARLDSRELANGASAAASAVTELEARLGQVERERQRVEKLVASSAATDEELEQASASEAALRASLEASRTRLREARRMVTEGVLVAPFSGTVSRVLLEPGEYAAAGKSVVEVSGDGDLELEVGVPEGLLRDIHEGATEAVEIPFVGGLQLPALVRSVGQAATGSGRLFPVVLTLGSDDRLRAGMTAEAIFSHRDQDALSVPLVAVVNPGGSRPAVFRLKKSAEPSSSSGGQEVERIEVAIQQMRGDRVLMTGPLAPGDEVVVRGHGGLLAGEAVEVLR